MEVFEFTTLGQIARAPEDEIQDINGIGEKQIEALRGIQLFLLIL